MSNVKIRKIPSDDREAFLGIAERFAERLRQEARAAESAVIDLRAASMAEDGSAISDLYVDGTYCLPEVYRRAVEA